VSTVRHAFVKPPAPVPERVPRIARLLALAHKFQGMLDRGEVESMAELARLGRVSRARVTQIMDLLMLAPEIQEEVLLGGVDLPLRELLAVVRHVEWKRQRARATPCESQRRREPFSALRNYAVKSSNRPRKSG
jgi:hypothetical protein